MIEHIIISALYRGWELCMSYNTYKIINFTVYHEVAFLGSGAFNEATLLKVTGCPIRSYFEDVPFVLPYVEVP